MIPFPDKKYNCIVADPPWPMKRNVGSLYPGATNTPPMKAKPLDYPVMAVSEIAALPVPDIAAKGCHLYLWTTQRFLRDAYTILDMWGFKQGAILVWSKPPKGVVGTWVCSAEFCIFARRGVLKHKQKHIGTVFEWKRRKHSEKPEQFQDLVETISPGPYIELFARRQREGWDVWGNEVLSSL
jgi:N6-adenosine-specific RNA methylase IME4